MNLKITPADTLSMQKAYDELKNKTLSSEKQKHIAAVIELIKKLRDPKTGCQWDKTQTRKTFAPCLLEETNEVLEAINENNPNHIKEELGDLLFSTFFLIQLAEEANEFKLEDVLENVLKKLVFRHPHVFGAEDRSNITSEEAYQLFQEAKKLEKQIKS